MEISGCHGMDTGFGEHGDLAWIASDGDELTSGERYAPSNQLTKLAGTHDEDASARCNNNLLLNVQSSCQRLGEDGNIRGDIVSYRI